MTKITVTVPEKTVTAKGVAVQVPAQTVTQDVTVTVPAYQIEVDVPDQPPAPAGMAVGMYNNCTLTATEGVGVGDTAANWKETRDRSMPKVINRRREFNSGLPASYNGGDVAHGIDPFLSFKSGYQAVVSGADKAKIQAFAKTWPPKTIATWQHEPENTSKEFAANPKNNFVLPFQTVYGWVKEVRPDVPFGPVHLAYQWGTSGKAYAARDQWKVDPRYADFYGIDWYNMDWNDAGWNIGTATDFQQWFKTFAPLGKPLFVSEFGIEAHLSDADTAKVINDSRTWADAHPEIEMVLYWNGVGMGDGNFQVTPTKSNQTGRPKALAALNAWATG